MQGLSEFMLLSLVPILSPGPAILLTATNSVHYGLRGGLSSASANGLAVSAAGGLMGICIGSLAGWSSHALLIVQILSATVLLYTGLKMFAGDWRSFVRARSTKILNYSIAFRTALMVGLTNPGVLSFFSVTLPLFIDPRRAAASDWVTLVICYGAATAAYHVFIAGISSMLRRHFIRPRTLLYLRKGAGMIFVCFSLLLPLKALLSAQ